MAHLNCREFLYYLLRRELSSLAGDVALDVGCSRMVTANYFLTETYYGLDLQRDRLESALSRKGLRRNAVGIVGQLPKLNRIASNCADVVVCTDVFFWLSSEDQIKAVRELARVCKSNGTLILTFKQPTKGIDRDSHLPLVRALFEQTKVRYYRGPITLGFTKVATALPVIASPLGRLWPLEYLTTRFWGTHVFVVAKGKKEKANNQVLDLSRLNRLADNLYSAADGPLPQRVKRQDLEAH